jgi:hypothetical protein
VGGTRVFSKGSGEVEIKLGQFAHESWTLPEVTGKFTFKDQTLRTNNLTLGKPDVNQVMIMGKLNLADPQNPSFDTALIARYVPIDRLFVMFGGMFNASLTGKTVWLKAHLQGQGGDLKQVTQSLKGRLAFNLKDGRINTGLLLNGAVQLFGIDVDPKSTAERARQHNTGYLNIFGEFSILNGVAHTKKFLYVAPFRRVGRVIEQIPIIGPIVTGGKEGSLITSYYKVEGPFSDPKVESVPFKTIGEKVLGTLEGIITAPSDLFIEKEPANP